MCQDAIVAAEQPVRPHDQTIEVVFAKLLQEGSTRQTAAVVQRSTEHAASVPAGS